MDMNDLVARNVARIRSERDLSLGELAQRAGISKQTLSKIEQGVGNPTVATLEAVGSALGVSFRRLVTEWGTPLRVSMAAEAQWIRTPTGETRHLDQVYGSGYVRTQLIVVDRAERQKTVFAHGPGTLHQVYMIEGRLEAGVGRDLRELGPGDFMRFPGDVDHHYRSVDGRAVAHLTTSAPQVPQFSREGSPAEDAWPE